MSWTEVELTATFAKYGKIGSARILYNPVTTASKCMGFVRFEQHQDAAAATSGLDGQIPPECYSPLIVKFAKDNGLPHGKTSGSSSSSFSQPAPTSSPYGVVEEPKDLYNLYLRELPLTMTQEDVRALLRQYGTIVTCALSPDRYTKQSRGVAFCRFETMEGAASALAALEGQTLEGSHTPLKIQYTRDTSAKKSVGPSAPAAMMAGPAVYAYAAPAAFYTAPAAYAAPAAAAASALPAAPVAKHASGLRYIAPAGWTGGTPAGWSVGRSQPAAPPAPAPAPQAPVEVQQYYDPNAYAAYYAQQLAYQQAVTADPSQVQQYYDPYATIAQAYAAPQVYGAMPGYAAQALTPQAVQNAIPFPPKPQAEIGPAIGPVYGKAPKAKHSYP